MASFGEELKRERELRDISLKEIAEATNISIRLLEALEQNNFGVLPGGAYTRGFIRSYARHIGVNIDEMVDAYQQELARQEAQRQAQRGTASSPSTRSVRRGVLGALVTAAFILSTAVIALIYWTGASPRRSGEASAVNAHAAALKARVKKSGALSSAPSETAPAAPGAEAVTGPPQDAPEPVPSMERLVRIKVRETTRVTLTCAGVPQYDKDLWVYAERHFPCREPILLSASNGGAVEYAIDSAEFRFLGEPGEIVRDRQIPVISPEPAGPEVPTKQKAPASTSPGATPRRVSPSQSAGAVS